MSENRTPAEAASFDVPGAVELPRPARTLTRSDQHGAIGCAAPDVDARSYRHELLAQAVVDGPMSAQIATCMPIFPVSVRQNHFRPSDAHTAFFRDHFVKKGAEPVDTIRMIAAQDV
jgi:6,7-dimethyl-8-ribityllumazine synthase